MTQIELSLQEQILDGKCNRNLFYPYTSLTESFCRSVNRHIQDLVLEEAARIQSSTAFLELASFLDPPPLGDGPQGDRGLMLHVYQLSGETVEVGSQ